MKNHHLMRVRIRKTVFARLQEIADEESMRTQQHVTVSDLVRNACLTYMLTYESLLQLENTPPDDLDDEGVLIGLLA